MTGQQSPQISVSGRSSDLRQKALDMSAPTPNPTPDPAVIASFLEFLFRDLSGHVVLRLIPEKGTPDGKPWTQTARTDDRLAAVAIGAASRALAARRGLYVVPATTHTPGRAREGDIDATVVVIVDIDTGDIAAQRDHLVVHLGPPSLEVASGGRTADGQSKRHLYFRLDHPASGPDLARVEALRAAIATAIGSDPAVARLTQPIRVAGSVHGKQGCLSPVTIIGRSAAAWSLDDLEVLVAAMPAIQVSVPSSSTAAPRPDTKRADRLPHGKIREGGQDGITRHDALTSVIGSWVRQVRLGKTSRTEAWEAVRSWNLGRIVPPWSDDHLRREFDAVCDLDRRRNPSASAGVTAPEVESDGRDAAPPLSEDDLARQFIEQHGAHLRHVQAWGRWLVWSGTQWQTDEIDTVRDLVRRTCRSAAGRADNDRFARSLASARTISAVERIASCDPAVALPLSALDHHPMLINTPAGIVDLETGALRPHDPALFITQITTASPGTHCPTWLRFLDEVADGDQDLIAYLARLCGYCLTGATSEQVFFFLHGQGANGKSVFLDTVSAILGSHAATAPFESFVASAADRHPTDLAGLRGTRLVAVAETEAGRPWAEARIKAITGGNSIRARLMHRDFFEFKPTFKLIFAGNHRPRLAGVGEAMRRRLHLVPFPVIIPPDRRDKHLATRLLAERDGILGWMLAGCLEWQRIGLAPPNRVATASAEYVEAEDVFGQWLDDRCVISPADSTPSAALYASWCTFCIGAGQKAGSMRWFGEELGARGFRHIRTSQFRGWVGVALRPEADTEVGPASDGAADTGATT